VTNLGAKQADVFASAILSHPYELPPTHRHYRHFCTHALDFVDAKSTSVPHAVLDLHQHSGKIAIIAPIAVIPLYVNIHIRQCKGAEVQIVTTCRMKHPNLLGSWLLSFEAFEVMSSSWDDTRQNYDQVAALHLINGSIVTWPNSLLLKEIDLISRLSAMVVPSVHGNLNIMFFFTTWSTKRAIF
jgi:hypothetical protein